MAKGKKTRKKLIEKLDALVKDITRLRFNWTCQKCGKKVSKSDAHTGHIIPRSKGNALRWYLDNLILFCFHCHIFWWHKNPLEAAEWFKEKYPEIYEYLNDHKNDIVQFKLCNLEDIHAELQGDYEELLAEPDILRS
jgi:5-methylcytosine-specific restriction endonuclease McrA